jgi:hypothetical protein
MTTIIGYSLPVLITGVIVFFIVKMFLDREAGNRQSEIDQESKKQILPVRLQAYERIILFLERISPENLILRVSKPGMSAFKLQTELIGTIRLEFEHNLSQQLYISSTGWDLVKTAKEDLIRTINTAASQLGQDADSAQLAGKIFEMTGNKKNNQINIALEHLKDEVRKLF